MTLVDTSPAVLVSIDRRLIERLLPGAIAEAEAVADGFDDDRERQMWIAGRLGALLEQVVRVGARE